MKGDTKLIAKSPDGVGINLLLFSDNCVIELRKQSTFTFIICY